MRAGAHVDVTVSLDRAHRGRLCGGLWSTRRSWVDTCKRFARQRRSSVVTGEPDLNAILRVPVQWRRVHLG